MINIIAIVDNLNNQGKRGRGVILLTSGTAYKRVKNVYLK